jgi:hypothetical protein
MTENIKLKILNTKLDTNIKVIIWYSESNTYSSHIIVDPISHLQKKNPINFMVGPTIYV